MNTFWQHQYLKLKNAVFPPALIVLGPPPEGGDRGEISGIQRPPPQRRRRWCPCKFRNPVVQPTRLLVCKQDRTLLFSIKALCLVGAISCLQLSKPNHCMNKDKSILTFITSISLRGYNTWYQKVTFLPPKGGGDDEN